jgi:hypothetical protein
VHNFAMLLPLALFAAVAFTSTFFPKVLPAMTNRWYSIIGAKTRVAEEDYAAKGSRAASFLLFVIVITWIAIRILSK